MTSSDLCDSIRWDLMRLVDGEATEEVRRRAETHMSTCEQCRREYEGLKQLRGVTSNMRLTDLPDARWEGYWQDLYRRLERGTGWLLLSLGFVAVLLYALFALFRDFFFNAEIPMVLRAGFALFAGGAVILLVSIVRERLYARKIERYDEVEL